MKKELELALKALAKRHPILKLWDSYGRIR